MTETPVIDMEYQCLPFRGHPSVLSTQLTIMNTTTFVTWATTGDQLPVTWGQARKRVSEAA